MNRIITAARLHTVAPSLALVLPWAIMASSFLINILIWSVTDVSELSGSGTGGLASLSLFAGWPLLLGLLFAVAGYFGIRRVFP